MRVAPLLRLCARPGLQYQQGQRPEPGIREYFYYIDDHGQLFLDDAKVKNFTTCFKDAAFLSFFFRHLERNRAGRFRARFPFVSRCGRERNFLRCSDVPVVFTHLLPCREPRNRLEKPRNPREKPQKGPAGPNAVLCSAGAALAVPFRPDALAVLPENGRVYHPAPPNAGGVGLLSSALARELSSAFAFGAGPEAPPTHFGWEGKEFRLRAEVLGMVRAERARARSWEG